MIMERVAFFIDGFNMYHSLKENAPDCRWLNLAKLCAGFLKEGEVVSRIYYFSAYATWLNDIDKIKKHQLYVNRLAKEGVIPIMGKFKEKTVFCPNCKTQFTKHEEKQTDVNIALKIVSGAMLNEYDTAILVSGDTDMIPAIRTVKEIGFDKKIGVLFPLGRKNKELAQCADISIKITRSSLKSSLFERETAPEGWVPEVSE